MVIHVVDGTYELFRTWFGAPRYTSDAGEEVGATRALVRSLCAWLRSGHVTHVAYAFDHVIESFRNELYDGYKTGAGVEPDLLAQFPLAEDAVRALGIVVWPMVEFEADDALATAAERYRTEPDVDEVRVCSVDKDLAQCVRGDEVVVYNRFKDEVMNEAAVKGKFGVPPSAIADYLALVGDAADGYPGVPRWGARSAAAVLARHGSIDAIPALPGHWDVDIRGAKTLAHNLAEHREDLELFRRLARLRTDVPLTESAHDLRWQGADRDAIERLAARLGDDDIVHRVPLFRDPS